MKIRILAVLIILATGCAGIRSIADDEAKKGEATSPAGFKATGNEPFWSLEIEFGNILKFTSLTEEYPGLIFPFSGPKRPGDLSLLIYHCEKQNAEMEVAIRREECMDTMKGSLFPYTVTASLRSNVNDEYTVFRGCGKYQDNYRLNDIWILKKINGEPIDIPDSQKYPRLEVDLANEVIFGYGGCNRFHGRGELLSSNLVTGNILSTRMACPGTMEIETKLLETLSDQTLEFSISDDVMKMTDGKTELFFKRED